MASTNGPIREAKVSVNPSVFYSILCCDVMEISDSNPDIQDGIDRYYDKQ